MAAITTAVVGAGAAAYKGYQEKKAGENIAAAEQQSAQMIAEGIKTSARIMKPAVQKATKMKILAAQRAADLEAAGLGDARSIYRDIMTGADNALAGLPPTQNSQQSALINAYQTAKEEFSTGIREGAAEFGAGFSGELQKESDFDQVVKSGQGMAEEDFRGFASGTNAFRMQLAMTGALGVDAQKQFYDQYQNSPKVQYQLNQIGRLAGSQASGGNKLRALQELITFNDNQNFSQLGELAERGQRFAERSADMKMKQAERELGFSAIETGIQSDLIREKAGLASENIMTQAGLSAEEATGVANTMAGATLRGTEARERARLATTDTLVGGLSDLGQAAGDIWGK